MTIKLEKYRQASEEEIQQAERQLGVAFPQDYREFVSQYDGAIPEENIFGNDFNIGIRNFISVLELMNEALAIERLPNNVWPIAADSNGNYICIRKNDFSVLFWDHEVENGDKHLASSFGEFLERLKPYDPSSDPLPPHRVISSWVDPDFKPEF